MRCGNNLVVTDGITTVDPTTEVDFTGATVTDLGGGVAGVDVSGGYSPPNSMEFLDAADLTIGAGSVGVFAWTRVTGSVLVGFASSNQHLLPLVAGIYCFEGTGFVTTAVGASKNFTIVPGMSNTIATWEQDTSFLSTPGGLSPSFGWSMTGWLDVTGSFSLQLVNNDASSRTFRFRGMAVTRIT